MKLSGFFIFILCTCVCLLPNYSTAQDLFSTHHATDYSQQRSIAGVKTKKEVFYKCTRDKELRWMRLYYQADGKCKTVYSKGGDAKEVSTSTNYATCEMVMNNIKKNLEDGSYVCIEKILLGSLEIE